ncbi:MAG: hypothetical protein DHS20C18_01870 [Saprospiraceae bacterium]|nr:MAG: hypothetical protein DHS20C18_01870 [Saprospiraceae bacterium]
MQLVLKKLEVTSSRAHLIRYGILLLLVLLVTHFVSYGKLPFQEDYQFPWLNFGVISVFGFVICTANWLVFRLIEPPQNENPVQQLLVQLAINSISSMMVYVLLYFLINILIFEGTFQWYHFFKYLLVCQSIVIGYVAVLSAVRVSQPVSFPAEKREKILVTTGDQQIQINLADIAFFHYHRGVVLLQLLNNQRYITDFSSLSELEGRLPADYFFRVNRQYILHKETVHCVQKAAHKTLRVVLDPALDNGKNISISVSRYKRKDFRKWLEEDKTYPIKSL